MKTRLTVPNDMGFLPVILGYVLESAKKAGFTRDNLNKIQLGVEESVTNVIEHAFAPEQKETFDIICEETGLGLTVIIKEKGLPFDPSQMPEYDREKLEKDFSDTGLGLHMMKQCMDEVSFHNLGREGKETRLVKYLDSRSVTEYMREDETRPEKKDDGPPEKIDYAVRLMNPSEAVEVSKCAYMSYGYTYAHENIYFPDRIRELNKAEEMISLVAVTGDGEIMGHIALLMDEYDHSSAEGGVAFVNPKFRGQGILKRLLDEMKAEGGRRDLTGIYGFPTTTHPYSQKGVLKLGMNDCALQVSKLPPAQYKGDITTEIMQRRSNLYSFCYINKPADSTYYIPAQHRDMIEKIYKNLGVAPNLVAAPEDGAAPLDGSARINVSTDNYMCAKIEIPAQGADVVSEVGRIIKRLCAERMETLYLYLDLSDRMTAVMTAEFENLGFFFSGIIPGATGKDRLLLQYLNNQIYNYDDLQIASDLGSELAAYIKAHDPGQRI